MNWYVENYYEICKNLNVEYAPGVRKTNVNFNYCLYNSSSNFIEHSEILFDLLLDQLQYKNECYKKLVTELMYGLYTASRNLAQTLVRIQMIETDYQQSVFDRVSAAVTDLFQCAEYLEEEFYYNPDTALEKITISVQKMYNAISLKSGENARKELYELMNSVDKDTR